MVQSGWQQTSLKQNLRVYAALWLCFFMLLGWQVKAAERVQMLYISDSQVSFEHFAMDYFVDTSQNMAVNDVLQQDFISASNSISLGTQAKVTWSRVRLMSVASEERVLYLHHPAAYHNRAVSLYVFRAGNLIAEKVLDFDVSPSSALLYGAAAVFPVVLPKGAQLDLYIKTESYSHQWFSLKLYDAESSKQALVGSRSDVALLVGMLLALMLYNIFLYISSYRIENIFYSLYLISGAVWIALSYGLLADQLKWYGQKVMMLHLTLIAMPMFLVLFMMSIFATRNSHPKEHRALLVVLMLLAGDFVYGLFDVVGALHFASSLAAMTIIITLWVAVSLLGKGNPFAKLFLVGHLAFFACNAVAVLYYKGLLPYNYFTSHSVGLGILLEALMLAFILSHRIKLLERMRIAQEELKRQAQTDQLTRAYNRHYFESEAPTLLQQAKKQKSPLSLLLLDLDKFKTINDNYSHITGDKVLRLFVELLRKELKLTDMIVRYGGEEFIVMLPDCDSEHATIIAERLRKLTAEQIVAVTFQKNMRFTVSIGVAQWQSGEALQDLILRADKALYLAKQAGRNRVCLFDGAYSTAEQDADITLAHG
ncbi:diguanylate cyclase [Pseudoalteromonas fenneropenaei]|uniref:diguanylate cyclase n=1 Tax=Pseudoalteromonas fenneropenaei TaxID=1737459 RepID=A0ABV7CEC2_9GAMM